MMLWLVFALMTAAAMFAVLWPLGRRTAENGGSDVAVYRDQLDEIARDRAAGLIGETEADAAKVEVSRRLIAAADAATANKNEPAVSSPLWRRRATALVALVLLPLGVVALYLALGSPLLPGEPLGPRLAAIHSDRSIPSLIAQVERHLETNPNDAKGYEVLAPIYLRLGRFDDAVNARRRILTLAANGIVTAEAKAAFDRAQALDAKDLKSRFYTGVAAVQDGKHDAAAAIWRGMLAEAPPDAP